MVGAWAFYGHQHYEEVQRIVLIADGVNDHNWQGPNQLNFHMLHALFPRTAVRSWETFLKEPPGQLVCMQHAFLSDRGISMKNPECKSINKHLGAAYTHMDPNAMESLSTRMQIYTHAQHNLDASALHITYIKRPPPRCLGNIIERRMIQALLDIPGVQLTVLDFAKLSFSKQIETILNTDILISVHGNALSYVLFLPRHASIIELFPPHTHHLDYRVFAHARGIDYYGILYQQDQFLEPGQAYQLGAYGIPNEGIDIVNCNLICHVVTQQFHKQLMSLDETSSQEKLVDQIAPVSLK